MPKSAEFSESRIQSEIVRFYRNTYCLKHHNPRSMIFSVPNESNGAKAMKLIQTGLYPGCADIVICHRRDHLGINVLTRWLFVEVKIPTGSQSIKQRLFQQHCAQCGIRYELVRSLDDFKQVIESIDGI